MYYFLSMTLLENSFRKKWTFLFLGRDFFGYIDVRIGCGQGIRRNTSHRASHLRVQFKNSTTSVPHINITQSFTVSICKQSHAEKRPALSTFERSFLYHSLNILQQTTVGLVQISNPLTSNKQPTPQTDVAQRNLIRFFEEKFYKNL